MTASNAHTPPKPSNAIRLSHARRVLVSFALQKVHLVPARGEVLPRLIGLSRARRYALGAAADPPSAGNSGLSR
jgi:hypothetical protein